MIATAKRIIIDSKEETKTVGERGAAETTLTQYFKLFAVTQEGIIDGDELTWFDSPKGWWKVLGEISPDATFVKDGEGYEMKPVRYNLVNDKWQKQLHEFPPELTAGEKIVFEVLCPTCKTYH